MSKIFNVFPVTALVFLGCANRAAEATQPDGYRNAEKAHIRPGNLWNCPFPAEADIAKIDEGKATLEVEVDAVGTIVRVDIRSSSGFGFGRVAKLCAQAQSYLPGHDINGTPLPRSKMFCHITFTR
jgi:periplasmic protein TonB